MKDLIKTNVPLADKTWFKTGGIARFFAEPTTIAEFQEALNFAQQKKSEIFVLGLGANILISDAGFNGLVIRPQLNTIMHRSFDAETTVTAGAGVSMHNLINYCLSHNLLGLEEFSGIPGTVGGSVYINLHYYEFLLEHFLIEARVIHKNNGIVKTVTPDWFNFGYDQSRLFEKEYFLIDATFKVTKVSDIQAAFAEGRSVEIIRHRVKRFPATHTCGSFFRNFHDNEVTMESNGKKIIYVAYYLDKVGIKGTLQVGDAIVSHQHANMIVNKGHASSTDIINLARLMQEKVHAEFGITPQPECQLIGFDPYPLL